MSDQEKKLDGPDFAQGVALADIEEGGMILGQVTGDAVLLARCGQELFAIGAECTHYHGPLAEGVVVEDTVRCPWHHACFSLRTGEALRDSAEPCPMLACRATGWDGICPGKGRGDRRPGADDIPVDAGGHRHCRRRRGGGSRCGDTAA